ncbi:MAG: glycosyltransferase family 2 protein [Candidatus Bathyarchaeota archaeon]|nr:MAG: glycosyltransferase family 2 protein [Candidatus Bathyarchaeota archaeon]
MSTPFKFLIADLRNVIAFFRKAKKPSAIPLEDYTLIVPIWGRFKILSFLKKKARNTIFLTFKKANSDRLKGQLKELEKLGARVIECEGDFEGNDDAKYHATKECLERGYVKTKYVVLLDADTFFRENIGKVCGFMEKDGLDIVTIKVVPSQHSNLLERLQKLEYRIAMRSRHYLPWQTSGACIVSTTDAMHKIMESHSLYIRAGDGEIGFLAKIMKMKVGHIDFKVYTRVPSTVRSWFEQRKRWWTGAFKHNVINVDKRALHTPLQFIYMFVFLYLFYPLRWIGILFMPELIPINLLIHIPIAIICSYKKPSLATFLYPFYSFFKVHLLFLPIIGIAEWIRIWRKSKTTGRIRIKGGERK